MTLAAAFLILALIEAFCLAALIQQGLDYRYEQRLIRAARIQELEREVGLWVSDDGWRDAVRPHALHDHISLIVTLPSGGAHAACICGWDGGDRATDAEAVDAHSAHLAALFVEPRP